MPRNDKTITKLKEKVDDNVCDLSLSGLSEVPVKEIAAFKRVTILDMSNNNLTRLGKNFSQMLNRLIKLDLSKNNITQLPDDFGLLVNLRHLDLFNNKIEHLPLSFASLMNLRYLDLKGNPLTIALSNVVGTCLTSKDCQDSARNTVRFLQQIRNEIELNQQKFTFEAAATETSNFSGEEKFAFEEIKPKKQKKKTLKAKSYSKTTSIVEETNLENMQSFVPSKSNSKTNRNTKKSNGPHKKSDPAFTAFTSISIFVIMLLVNVVAIYLIMFKNPDLAEKLVEYMPQQYRDWITRKSEIFRLRVSDWISEFRTPPEEQ